MGSPQANRTTLTECLRIVRAVNSDIRKIQHHVYQYIRVFYLGPNMDLTRGIDITLSIIFTDVRESPFDGALQWYHAESPRLYSLNPTTVNLSTLDDLDGYSTEPTIYSRLAIIISCRHKTTGTPSQQARPTQNPLPERMERLRGSASTVGCKPHYPNPSGAVPWESPDFSRVEEVKMRSFSITTACLQNRPPDAPGRGQSGGRYGNSALTDQQREILTRCTPSRQTM